MPPHQLIFVSLEAMGFHHVGKAGLKLLTSGDLPASVSQNAGITGVSHCTQLTQYRIDIENEEMIQNKKFRK